MNPKTFVFALAVAALALPASSQIYKWVDDKGRTHYGEKPPEGVKAVEMGAPPPSPSGNTAPPPQPDWKQKELEAKLGTARAACTALETEIELHVDEIVELEAFLAEAMSVVERLEHVRNAPSESVMNR